MTDSHILCLECGRWYRMLAKHLRTHDLDTAAYRLRHGLATSLPLAAPTLRETMAANAGAQYPGNTKFQRKPTAVQRRRSRLALAEARTENAGRIGYQKAMADLHHRRSQQVRQVALARYHELARAAGYQDLDDMLRHTWTLTDKQFGNLLGLSESGGGHVRTRHGKRPEPERHGTQRRALQYIRAIDRKYDSRARTAGYKDIKTLLGETRSLNHRELADLLGISPQAAGRLRHEPTLARLRPGDGSPITAKRGSSSSRAT